MFLQSVACQSASAVTDPWTVAGQDRAWAAASETIQRYPGTQVPRAHARSLSLTRLSSAPLANQFKPSPPNVPLSKSPLTIKVPLTCRDSGALP